MILAASESWTHCYPYERSPLISIHGHEIAEMRIELAPKVRPPTIVGRDSMLSNDRAYLNRIFPKEHKSIRRSFETDRKHCINVLNASSSSFKCKASESHPEARRQRGSSFSILPVHFWRKPELVRMNLRPFENTRINFLRILFDYSVRNRSSMLFFCRRDWPIPPRSFISIAMHTSNSELITSERYLEISRTFFVSTT